MPIKQENISLNALKLLAWIKICRPMTIAPIPTNATQKPILISAKPFICADKVPVKAARPLLMLSPSMR